MLGTTPRRLLCLDFDGVLHPSTDVLDFATSGLPLTAYVQSRPHLLRWAPLLAQALDGFECEILVHSSWRNEFLDSDLRGLLSTSGLDARFVGSAPRGVPRERAILDVAAVMGIEQDTLIVLDDAYTEFDRLAPQLIVCNPLLGVSDLEVLAELRRRLGGGGDDVGPDVLPAAGGRRPAA